MEVKVKVLIRRFISEYKKGKTTSSGRVITKELAKGLLRIREYRKIFWERWLKINAWQSELGWILFDQYDEEGLKRFVDVYKEMCRDIGINVTEEPVEIVEISVPRDWLIKQLEKYMLELDSKIDEIRAKMQDIRNSKSISHYRVKLAFYQEAFRKCEEFLGKLKNVQEEG